jgi:hypothetical protein
MFTLFLILSILMVVFLLLIALQKPSQPTTLEDRRLSGPERQRTSRLLQRARNQEMWDFVTSGNRQWAVDQLAQTDPVIVEGAVEDALMIWGTDPFEHI